MAGPGAGVRERLIGQRAAPPRSGSASRRLEEPLPRRANVEAGGSRSLPQPHVIGHNSSESPFQGERGRKVHCVERTERGRLQLGCNIEDLVRDRDEADRTHYAPRALSGRGVNSRSRTDDLGSSQSGRSVAAPPRQLATELLALGFGNDELDEGGRVEVRDRGEISQVALSAPLRAPSFRLPISAPTPARSVRDRRRPA